MNATRIDEIHRLPRATETAKTRESYEPTCLDLAGLHSTNPKKSIRDGILPASRHVELLQLLQTQGQATINELATWLGVSDATVRRDLDRLAGQKRLTRTYGGAMVNAGALPCSLGFGDRMHAPERRIAQAVCRLIGDGETLLVNSGVTVRRIVSELAQKRLTVITNDLCLPAALPSNLKVYVLGGEYMRGAPSHEGAPRHFGDMDHGRLRASQRRRGLRGARTNHGDARRSVDDFRDDGGRAQDNRVSRRDKLGQNRAGAHWRPRQNAGVDHRRTTARRFGPRANKSTGQGDRRD